MSSLKSRRKALAVPAWTDAAIRAATLLPKPQGAIDRVYRSQGGDLLGPLDSVERSMLRTIAETADLIDAGEHGHHLPRFWLLVPAPGELIDFLSTFEVERGEDIGVDDCREADSDDEPDSDEEPEVDDGEGSGPVVTEERRARYRASRDGAADDQPFRLLPVYRANDGRGAK